MLGGVPLVPVLLASRAQTDQRYVPAAMLGVVFQVNELPLDQPRARVQVPSGSLSQNSYWAEGQPAAVPVTVTLLPRDVVFAGIADALMPVHGAVVSA